jgi:hypothetical protein
VLFLDEETVTTWTATEAPVAVAALEADEVFVDPDLVDVDLVVLEEEEEEEEADILLIISRAVGSIHGMKPTGKGRADAQGGEGEGRELHFDRFLFWS